jgi:site-specific DNA recombinase
MITMAEQRRLTRSLADFAKIVEIFDARDASFVSVTQQFNPTTWIGRLTLNVDLFFAQFEREVIGERIRDKIAASKRKGMWMGGVPPLGYRVQCRKLDHRQRGGNRALHLPPLCQTRLGSVVEGGTRRPPDQEQVMDQRFGSPHWR